MLSKKPFISVATRLKQVFEKPLSLSTYFPEGTQFYYGYPAGEDSGFLNLASPYTTELIAARAVCCAGPNVSIVCYEYTTEEMVGKAVYDAFDLPRPSSKPLVIPALVSPKLDGQERNEMIKQALSYKLKPNSFIMAQPFLDPSLDQFYKIPAEITLYLNDKSHMQDYIGEEWLPRRLGTYKDGKEFAREAKKLDLPVVIKASSSSSGNGVFLCRTQKQLQNATDSLRSLKGTIIADEYIQTEKNYGVHFGVPHDKSKPIDLIGVNEQITSRFGEYMGGVIDSIDIPKALDGAVNHLINEVLPKVREKGWYGIGGFDILTDKKGRAFFIDCNFRMTGMSAYHFMVDRRILKKPLMSISGEFEGTEAEFIDKLAKYTGKKEDHFIHLICVSKHDNLWLFNGALEYENFEQLKERAWLLLDAGVISDVLEMVVR